MGSFGCGIGHFCSGPKARLHRWGCEDQSPRGFSPPPFEATLECPQLPVRIDTGMLSLQPLEQFATGPLRLSVEPLPKERPGRLKRVATRAPPSHRLDRGPGRFDEWRKVRARARTEKPA